MAFEFKQVSYDEILPKLIESRNWLTSLGRETSIGRFAELIDYIEKVCDFQRRGELDELVKKYDNEILWYSLIESWTFVEVYEAFHNLKSHQVPRSKLTKILGGPFLPRNEAAQDQNIHSRNTLFELLIAAKFKKANLEITGFDDVDFVFDEVKFNVQCKRIHSHKKIEGNLNEAIDQFTKKKESTPNLRGLIAFSIDKLTGKEGKILKTGTVQDIEVELVRHINDFVKNYHELFGNIVNTNILGIVISFQTAAIIKNLNLLTRCHLLGVDLLCSSNHGQLNDYHLMKKLGLML